MLKILIFLFVIILFFCTLCYSAAIDATWGFMYFYSKGVFTDTDCSPAFGTLNHAVLAVGYGVSKSQKYWLIKNSWGSTSGESGYIRFAKDNKNMCGVATAASYPVA